MGVPSSEESENQVLADRRLQTWQKYQYPGKHIRANTWQNRYGSLLSMKHVFVFAFALLLALLCATPRAGATSASSDDAFWVSFWGQPRVILYGPEEQAFYQNLREVMFARNEYDRCLNPNALDDDARWLKEHPGVRFYIDGYASTRGDVDLQFDAFAATSGLGQRISHKSWRTGGSHQTLGRLGRVVPNLPGRQRRMPYQEQACPFHLRSRFIEFVSLFSWDQPALAAPQLVAKIACATEVSFRRSRER